MDSKDRDKDLKKRAGEDVAGEGQDEDQEAGQAAGKETFAFGAYALELDQANRPLQELEEEIELLASSEAALSGGKLIMTRDGRLIKELQLIQRDEEEDEEEETAKAGKDSAADGTDPAGDQGAEAEGKDQERDKTGQEDDPDGEGAEAEKEERAKAGKHFYLDLDNFAEDGRYMIRYMTEDACETITFSLDREGPSIEEAKMREEDGGKMLYLRIYDRSGVVKVKARDQEGALPFELPEKAQTAEKPEDGAETGKAEGSSGEKPETGAEDGETESSSDGKGEKGDKKAKEGDTSKPKDPWLLVKVEAKEGLRLKLYDGAGNLAVYRFDGERLIEEDQEEPASEKNEEKKGENPA